MRACVSVCVWAFLLRRAGVGVVASGEGSGEGRGESGRAAYLSGGTRRLGFGFVGRGEEFVGERTGGRVLLGCGRGRGRVL